MDGKILVFGCGISGIGASNLLSMAGEDVILYDANTDLNPESIEEKLEQKEKVTLLLGELSEEVMDTLSMAVLSPGVPTDLPVVNRMREKHIPISGELELAYTYGKGDVLAITGTNGKTTTTTLLGEILKAYKKEVYVVGNIGNPYTTQALSMTKESVTVAEVSSFQLETICKFHPKVSAILNITPDHLNRHHTMENYIRMKERIAENQGEADTCVLNFEDEETRKFGESIKAQVLYFSSQRTLEKGIFLKDGNIIYKDEEPVVVCHVSELQLLGTHNYENVMAAVAMAAVYGVPMDMIRRVVKDFAGVAHRIEYVCEKNGVAYYNDSKGTNPDAAIRGIRAMNRPTFLIGGGYDKNSTYEEWIEAFDGKVKCLILLGQTREKIARTARKLGFENIIFADSLEEAVKTCSRMAEPGDAVLLSPACASWGMFRNYEERGDKFKELANSL